MRREARGVKSGGDDAKVRSLGPLLVDNLLRIVEAATALRFAVKAGVSCLGGRGAGASGGADVGLGQAVADTDDHDPYIVLMRPIRNSYQLWRLRRVRAAIKAMGMPTRTMWANSCVAIDSGLGGQAPKRSGTTIRFIAT